MIFEQLSTGGDRNFAYIIGDDVSKEAAVVDPSNNPELIIVRAKERHLKIKYIINTHSHYDHTNGNKTVKDATGALVAAYKHSEHAVDVPLEDKDVLNLGELQLHIIHTPGHTNDSICILAGNKLCTGDTLFVGKVGGTDFCNGARQEYDSLHKKLMTLPDDVEVYPGHNYGVTPFSTIKKERKTNLFLIQKSFEDFVHLKKNWAEYKRKHNIT